MGEDTTDTNWEHIDVTDRTDRRLITDISESIAYLSGKSRDERRKQKLREQLVREYIENQEKSTSFVGSLIDKIVRMN